MATAKCPACGLSLGGMPDTRRVLVTCPSAKGGCGSKFYFPPTERSIIALRCAQDGRSFTASFKRDAGQVRFTIDRMAVSKPGPAGEAPAPAEAAYNVDAYDFSGFYCPCCGASPDGPSEGVFVKCGKCSELVCQGLSYNKLDEQGNSGLLHVCYPECGNQGFITHRLGEVQASRHRTVERAPVARLASNPAPLQLDKPVPLKLRKG